MSNQPQHEFRVTQSTHISVPASLAWSILLFVAVSSIGAATMLQSIRGDLDFIKFRLSVLESVYAGGVKP